IHIINEFLNPEYQMFWRFYSTMICHFHIWRIGPAFVERSLRGQTEYSLISSSTISDRFISYPAPRILLSGRKSRLFRRLFKTPIRKYFYEWKVEVQARQNQDIERAPYSSRGLKRGCLEIEVL